MDTLVHRRTPSLAISDSRGLPVRQVAYLRTVAGEAVTALVTRQLHDIAGRQVAQQDPRLPMPNIITIYGLAGTPLKVDSVDAGWRLNLPGLAGQALERWDARGSHWRTTYDDQLRVVAVEENAQPDVDTFTYADASADAGLNLRGRLLEQTDSSGSLSLSSYGLLGSPLRDTRTFHDGKAFTSQRTYSPLGAELEQTDAGGHRRQVRYDLAGQLRHLQLKLKGQTDWQPVLVDAQYNAAGQIIEQQTGNLVTSQWDYDPADGRLHRQSTRHNQKTLQNFEYEYDPVGNITRIIDDLLNSRPRHFSNQKVDGDRAFSYDSLYRLHTASGYDDGPPSDIPGLPQPADPNDRRNYTQTYQYDHGGNLIELCHSREGASHTRQMSIDSASNRGVRWTPGDQPDFDKLFDRHGNLQALQPGQPMQWNARDQLELVTLIERDGSANDEEQYRYSQGARVYKRHDTHTTKISHFHEVCYLPGLEIRTCDNGEELHVITLAAGSGSVRCLHWVTSKPIGIDNDQLRYTLDDHLGSCVMELDQQAQMINHEGYYPFGATAWMAARSVIEVEYKFIRYSGKEMDVSGLYYYGARYYAPWLQRWVSADPAGDVDGLNLYGFVGNNPLSYFDDQGKQRTPSELKNRIVSGFQFLSSVHHEMNTLDKQLADLSSPAAFRLNILKNLAYQIGNGAVGWYTSFHAAGAAGGAIPNFTNAYPHLSGGVFGMLLGNRVADKSTGLYAQLMSPLKLDTSIVPDPSAFSADTLKERAGLVQAGNSDGDLFRPATGDELMANSTALVSRTVGAYIPGVGEAFAMAKVAEEANQAEEGMFPAELNEIESTLEQLREATVVVAAQINADFAELGIKEFYDQDRLYLRDLVLGRVGTDKASTVRQATLSPFKERAINDIKRTQLTLKRYGRHVAGKTAKRAA